MRTYFTFSNHIFYVYAFFYFKFDLQIKKNFVLLWIFPWDLKMPFPLICYQYPIDALERFVLYIHLFPVEKDPYVSLS